MAGDQEASVSRVHCEPTRVVRQSLWLARRAEQLARQLDEAAAFVPPETYEEGAPRALLVV